MRSYVKLKWTFIGLLAVALSTDWIILDRWQVHGWVNDSDSRTPLADAWVIADFSGEAPLLTLSFTPHPKHRTNACMGTQVTRTNMQGRFRFDELAFNRPLANKHAYILIFKPGWIASARSTSIRSSLFLPPPQPYVQSLRRGPGTQQTRPVSVQTEALSTLAASEFTRSDELLATLMIAGQRLCDPTRTEVSAAALSHALSIAKTFDERERVRATCGLAAEQSQTAGLATSWSFDCNNLPFRHQPSDEVLATEAAIEVKHDHMPR